MEYSPMLVLMLWALTPSDAASVEARVQEVPTPGMTVHQESYFTFNHGRPFVAEQDPLTGAILNLKTTPVLQDDYVYEEEDEEADGIDRKDGPKVISRNDIVPPSKDPDLHKFLNLPVHYSTSGKFPLISSSYANTKIQGHGAGSQSNHRLSPTTSTSTVSPSYYSHKASPTTPATTTTTKASTTKATAATSTTIITTTSTTTTVRTTRNPTTTSSTPKPFSAYEYEYDYDYDREPPPPEDPPKKSTTQSILDFFGKDYEFLGASDEVKNDTVPQKVQPTSSDKPKDEGLMISSNTNIFIPAGYLKPNTTEKSSENKTLPLENKVKQNMTVSLSDESTNSSTNRPDIKKPEDQTEIVTPMNVEKTTKEPETIEERPNEYSGGKSPSKEATQVTALKLEVISTTKAPKVTVPFFPSNKEDQSEEESRPQYSVSEEQEDHTESKPLSKQEQRPTQRPQEEMVVSRPGYPHLYKPSDVKPNRPIDMMPPPFRPLEYHQRPYMGTENVQTTRPLEIPQARPIDPQYKPQLTRPIEQVDYRPKENEQKEHDIRPLDHGHNRPTEFALQTQNRPAETPVTQHKHVETKIPQVTRPIGALPTQRPAEIGPAANRPFEGLLNTNRPIETGSQNRPHETVKVTQTRPTDSRYPPYIQAKPERPYIPEYRPLGPRPDVQEFNVGLGSRVPDFNKNRPEPTPPSYNKYQVQFNQPSKVENHFIKVSPGQENPSYSLQTSFSIGVPPSEESHPNIKPVPTPGQGVGQVLFPEEEEKRPWSVQEEKKPLLDGEKYPRPPWESHLKPPLVFNHMKKEPYLPKRPKPRPDLPNILPQFRPNAKLGHAEPHVYLKTPLDTLQPPPLPRPQFLRAEPLEEDTTVHRRNGQSPRVPAIPLPAVPLISNSMRGSLRSEDEKTDPVFVVYPSNNAQDGVVVGTRGSQKPLPPDNLDVEDSFPLDTNKNFQARVDTPILKVKQTPKPPIKNEFPYPLIKPTEIEEKVVTSVTKEYTAFSPTVSPAEREHEKEKEHDTEINVIPYLQDYMPFATKKPSPETPTWNVGDDVKPISVTLKTSIESTTHKTKVENHKIGENSPTPQDFQAPFHASLTAPSQGWSVVRPRPTETEKSEETTTAKQETETEGTFDIQNFKPQLFGGFKPIIPPVDIKQDKKEDKDKV